MEFPVFLMVSVDVADVPTWTVPNERLPLRAITRLGLCGSQMIDDEAPVHGSGLSGFWSQATKAKETSTATTYEIKRVMANLQSEGLGSGKNPMTTSVGEPFSSL
jgi:hypothetical protein